MTIVSSDHSAFVKYEFPMELTNWLSQVSFNSKSGSAESIQSFKELSQRVPKITCPSEELTNIINAVNAIAETRQFDATLEGRVKELTIDCPSPTCNVSRSLESPPILN